MTEIERDFKECFAELDVEQQQALVAWVRKHLAPGKPTQSSYGLKHCAGKDLGFYIRNEQMKRAMELAGLEIEDKSKVNGVPKRLRYYGRPIPTGSFLAWLTKHLQKDTGLGDFARDAVQDKSFPEAGDYQTFSSYLRPRFGDNRSGWNAFVRAWRAYQKERRQTGKEV